MKKPDDLPYPLILVIDTTEREKVRLAVVDHGQVSYAQYPTKAQELQQHIYQFLAAHHHKVTDLRAVAVYRLPGSLTGVRMGVVAANTLAWLLQVPVVEIDSTSFEAGLKKLTDDFLSLKVVRQTKTVE